MAVFVLEREKPLMPCCERRPHLLPTRSRAIAHPRHPFTVSLKDSIGGDVQPVWVKIDPGSKATSVAIITEGAGNKPAKLLCVFELAHRGRQISEAVRARRVFRRRRRARSFRHRVVRFDNRAIKAQARARSQDAANATPRASYEALTVGDLPAKVSSGGRTEYHRRPGIEKMHALEAACIGDRVAVGAGGSLTGGTAETINAKYCKLLHRADGYGYTWRPALPSPADAGGLHRGRFG